MVAVSIAAAVVPVRVLRVAVAPEVTLTADRGDERDEAERSEDDPEHGEQSFRLSQRKEHGPRV
jgi:hypothetical protein